MTEDRTVLWLVVNPSAGRGRARTLLPKVVTELVTSLPEADLRVHLASSFAEAAAHCHRAAEEARPAEGTRRRPDALLVMGGDGMMHLGANACAGTAVPLGLIPAGTGNDSCRGLGLPPANPVAAARVVVRGDTRRIDLAAVAGDLARPGSTRPEYVLSIVSTGFDAAVNLRANQTTFPRGRMRYAFSAATELALFEPRQYRLDIDGDSRVLPAILVAVGNAGYFGGGMRMCPDADVEDGLLDLTIVHPVSRATFLRLLPSLFTGTFVRDPAFERLRARTVVVDGDGLHGMADGDELGPVPLTVSAAPQALTVFAAGGRRLRR